MSEKWLPVVGYEGLYAVSDQGRVRSLDRIVLCRSRSGHKFTRTIRGTLKAAKINRNGYAVLQLWKRGEPQDHLVHQLVLTAFIGPAPLGMEACHNDGVRTNNILTNLRWDTRSQNHFDTVRHGNHRQASKTECPQGHPYSAENTYVVPGQRARLCRTCRRIRNRDYAYKRRRSA